MCTFTLESTHFIFNKCPIYNHDGASAKFSPNSHETDKSACDPHMTSRWRRIPWICRLETVRAPLHLTDNRLAGGTSGPIWQFTVTRHSENICRDLAIVGNLLHGI